MAIEFTVDHDHTYAAEGGIQQLIGWITFSLGTYPGDFRVRDLGAGMPRTMNIPPRRGWLAPDGHLYRDQTLAQPCRLVANDPAFNLRHLTYRADFALTTLAGDPVAVPHTFFSAPSADSTLPLTKVMSDPYQPVMEIRAKVYTEDIIDAGDFGQNVVFTGTPTEFWELAGTVPSTSLPAYVDDVLEFTNQAAFPVSEEARTGVIYVDLSTNDTFRWSGSTYTRISDRITVSGITDAGTAGKALVRAETQADALRALGGIPRQEPKSLLQVGPYAFYELSKMPDNARWLNMGIYRLGGSPTAEEMSFFAAHNWEVLWSASAPDLFSNYANQAAFNAAYLASIDAVMNVYGPRGSYWTADTLANGHKANSPRYSPIAAVEIMNEPNIWWPWPGGNSYAPQYASALIAAYDHIKTRWPEVKVVACSAMGAQAAAPSWTNAVMDALIAAGRLDAFDVVSAHGYTDGSQSPEAPMYEAWIAEPHRPITVMGSVATYAALPGGLTSGDAGKAWRVNADSQLYVWTGSAWPAQGVGQLSWNLDTEMQQVKQGLIARGVTRPLWLTEIGWNISHADGGYYYVTSTDNLGNPDYVSPTLQAAYSVRAAMMAARAGIERIYYMNVADTDGTNMGWFNTNAGALSGIEAGSLAVAPRPVAVAMRLLNRLISGATQFEVLLDGSAAPLTAPYAYRFTTPRGRVTVAWCQGGSTTAIPIDPDTTMTVTDQVGTIIATLPVGTTSYTATLSATPIFISPGVSNSPRHRLISVTSSVALPSDPATDYIVQVGSGGAPILPTARDNKSLYQISNIDTTSKTVTPGGTDPSVVIHVEGEGTNGATAIVDDSGNAWTCAHSAAISTTQHKFGSSSLKFTSGTSDYISTPASSSFNPGANPFTFEFWMYPTSIPGGYWWGIMATRTEVLTCPFMVYGYGQKVAWFVGGANLGSWLTAFEYSGSDVFTVNTWHHIAVVGKGAGNPITLYVNGVAALTNTQPDFGTTPVPIVLGADPTYAFMTGHIDDVRYTVGNAVYTSGFTPPSSVSQYLQQIDGSSSLTIAPSATAALLSTGTGWTNTTPASGTTATDNSDGTATL